MKDWQRGLYDAVMEDGVVLDGWEMKPTWHRDMPFGPVDIEDMETHILEITREENLDEDGNGEIVSVLVGVEKETKWPRRPWIAWAGVETLYRWGASHNAYGGEERSFSLLAGEALRKAISWELLEEVEKLLKEEEGKQNEW